MTWKGAPQHKYRRGREKHPSRFSSSKSSLSSSYCLLIVVLNALLNEYIRYTVDAQLSFLRPYLLFDLFLFLSNASILLQNVCIFDKIII